MSRFTRSVRAVPKSVFTLPALTKPSLATRAYTSKSSSCSKASCGVAAIIGAALGAAGYGYYQTTLNYSTSIQTQPLDYQEVYNAIAELLDENEDYDDGSYAPVLLRLAWHAAGTFDKASMTGGSCGATMRFGSEAGHGGNAGLLVARKLMERIKERFPAISYSDLWSLAGVVAVQEMGGPTIPWRAGRVDKLREHDCTPDGRLPDASQGAQHVRDIFYRMGFNDQEITALNGAHALGRCHTDRSGFDGPWTASPTVFTNDFYRQLLEQKWVEKKWNGPKQFVDKATGGLMMLPSDMAFLSDKTFRPIVEAYAKDEALFFTDFSKAFVKLQEVGVQFKEGAAVHTFKPTNA